MTPKPIKELLGELTELLGKAVQGELHFEGGETDPRYPGVLPKWTVWDTWSRDVSGLVGAGIVTGGSSTFAYLNAREPQATLIVAAVNNLPALIAEVRRLQKEAQSFGNDDFALELARSALSLSKKAMEWQVYLEQMERDTNAPMAEEIQRLRREKPAAEIARVEAIAKLDALRAAAEEKNP